MDARHLVALAALMVGCGSPVESVVATDAAAPDSAAPDTSVAETAPVDPIDAPADAVVDTAPDASPDDTGDAAPTRYKNLVLDESGDPFCDRFGGTYYVYLPQQVRKDGVGVGGRVIAFKSKDLVRWESVGEVFNNVDDFYGGQKTIGLWAPEVFAHDGKFYLYYASLMSDPPDGRVGDKDIVVIESSSPESFKGGKRTVLLDDAYSFIDPTMFKDPMTGKLFLLYKRRGAFGTGSQLEIRAMTTPTAVPGPATRLVDSEEYSDSDHVVEQPTLWRSGGLYYLLFSKGYGGRATYHIAYQTSAQPTGPYVHRGVLYRSDSDLTGDLSRKVIAPGASSIVRDGGGKLWMVYRQKTTTADTFADRGVAIDPIDFDEAGKSIVGTPTKGVFRPAPVPLP